MTVKLKGELCNALLKSLTSATFSVSEAAMRAALMKRSAKAATRISFRAARLSRSPKGKRPSNAKAPPASTKIAILTSIKEKPARKRFKKDCFFMRDLTSC
jgi:hypothetical protein